MTLTKADLADMLFEQLGLSKREARDVVKSFYEEISLTLEAGDSVNLSGFGNFTTGEGAVTFEPSVKLKDLARGSR
jgi:nucleoid DNA-binding protein